MNQRAGNPRHNLATSGLQPGKGTKGLFAPTLAAVIMTCVATCVATTARADDWGVPGLDAAHGRLSAERSGALFTDGRWKASFQGGARMLASPVVTDGFVVTVDLEGAVHALRADDGRPLWQAAAGSGVHGTPAVAQGRVFIPTLGNKVVALRLGNGTPLWTRELGGAVLSSPTPVGGDIVVASGFPKKHVVRLSGGSGELVWRSPDVMEQFSNTPPAVGAGVVVVGTNGGHYYAFDIGSGAPRWHYVADGIVHLAAPIVAGDRVYMAGGNGSNRVHSVNAATGTAAPGWPIDLPTPDPDIAGTKVGRRRAVSSFSAAGGLLLLQTRLDDTLDTNADGGADKYLSREIVAGLDPATGKLVWQHALARAERTDPNDVPKFFVCPTPASFGTVGGSPLVAVASSLEAVVAVLDVATGGERARHAVAGPALASPVVANGRLYATAINGTVEGLLSSVNHPPTAPILGGNQRPLDSADVKLRWLPAVDADGEIPSYELRIDNDGELLETWLQQMVLGAGVTSTRIAVLFTPGVRYSFAVRARDSHGAYSPWSSQETFQVTTNPPVTVGGTPATSLGRALREAQPGDKIVLGAGTYALSETLHVGGGVSIQGAGAGRTTLDATGLAVGVSFESTAAGHAAGLDGVTVAGADTCVQVGGGSTGVRLAHLIARDCRTNGVAVAAKGGVEVVNATLVGNGTAVDAAGAATIRNSLLTMNGVALAGEASGEPARTYLASTYNDLFGNQTDYRGLAAGTGDMSTAVTFADLGGRDLRLLSSQSSTDKGDPADEVGAEPAPTGERINLGAFGGTADAEQSALSTAVSGNGASPGRPVPHSPTPGRSRPQPTEGTGGCAMAGSRSDWIATPVLLMLLARRRRRSNV